MQARRARSMSPERERSFADARGYGSDSEALGGLARSQSFLHPAHDPLADSCGDIYSPLRSGIRPGSFTFASLNELGARHTLCSTRTLVTRTERAMALEVHASHIDVQYTHCCRELRTPHATDRDAWWHHIHTALGYRR